VTSATHRAIILEGAVLDCEMPFVPNRATRAQAAATTAYTAVPALDVEAFDVDVPERQISGP
jgi:hypothetical protein